MISESKYSPEVRERAVRMVFEHRAEHASGPGHRDGRVGRIT